MKISVITPIYNEEKTIRSLLQTIEPIRGKAEILFVDGGSTDNTRAMIPESYTVLESPKGRANQMNYGARHSTGDVLSSIVTANSRPMPSSRSKPSWPTIVPAALVLRFTPKTSGCSAAA